MNLSRIRGDLAKLQELAAERARRGARPLTVIVLPDNGRGPESDDNGNDLGPSPRVAWRNECAVCIVCDAKSSPPASEEIGRLIEATP